MGSLFGADKASMNAILNAIRKESNASVARAMLSVVGSRASRNPSVGKRVLEMADHSSPRVRREAISWLTSSWGDKVPGRVAKVIEKIERDKDGEVRAYACENAGKIAHDRFVPIFEKLTRDAKNSDLYSSCMKGIVASFFSYPFFQTHSAKGYALFLKRIKDGPRSEQRPPWTLTDSFEHYAKNDNTMRKWKKNAPFFKPAEVIAALREVITDENANFMARTGAVDSLTGLGATQATFQALITECTDPDGKPSCYSSVMTALKKAAAKAK